MNNQRKENKTNMSHTEPERGNRQPEGTEPDEPFPTLLEEVIFGESIVKEPQQEMREHHPSCSPHDRDLVWHCYQCGLNESAEEIENELDALKTSIADLSHPNCQQLLKDIATEREAAKKLCEIYFNIAAEAIGEDEVRCKRDEAIKEAK